MRARGKKPSFLFLRLRSLRTLRATNLFFTQSTRRNAKKTQRQTYQTGSVLFRTIKLFLVSALQAFSWGLCRLPLLLRTDLIEIFPHALERDLRRYQTDIIVRPHDQNKRSVSAKDLGDLSCQGQISDIKQLP